MKQQVKYQLTGAAPLLMHNGTLADPLSAYSKAIKKITDKSKKTEADLEEVGRLEWFGSLYLLDGTPCIPREAIKATLLRAGKTLKKGPKVKAGIVCEDHALLQYDGPKDPQALWLDKQFVYRTTKPQGQVRIVRTRPIFPRWGIDLMLAFNDEMLNPDELDQIVTIAGQSIGLLEERPEYGRFEVRKL
jgi:hypothetical protein